MAPVQDKAATEKARVVYRLKVCHNRIPGAFSGIRPTLGERSLSAVFWIINQLPDFRAYRLRYIHIWIVIKHQRQCGATFLARWVAA